MIRPFDLIIRGVKLLMLLDIEPGRYYSDYALGTYLDNKMCPEPELVHVLFRALKPGDLVVDAGACVGFFTIIMSKLVGPAGKVIAIEPDSRNLAMLRKNLDINDCTNVEIVEYPIASSVRRTDFFQNEENGQSSLWHGGVSQRIETTILSTLLRSDRATLLKLDIEGSELEALQGLHEYHSRIPYIVSEVNPDALKRADTSPDELVEWLYYRGNFPHVLHESGALPSRVHKDQQLKITRQNTNMLFCGEKDLVSLWPEVEA